MMRVMETQQHVDVTRVRNGLRSTDSDHAATEAPLEVRLNGRPFSVIMRTPGADRELTAGFLFSESVVKSAADLGSIESGANPQGEHAGNIVDVTLARQSLITLDRLMAERRNVTTNSSCGLCGRVTIESLRIDAPPLPVSWTVAASTLIALPDELRRAQTVFDSTGGLHAAGLFSHDGRLEASAEDVGRHNAVDKVVGRMLLEHRLPLRDCLMFVSGRTSYEIVQKAFLAGISLVAAVSAPSSLAIELAQSSGMTLIGFLRGASFNIYSHGERVTS
jgi:FdhD protein